MKRFRDPCQQHFLASTATQAELGWNETHDRSVIDFLNDVKAKALFVSATHQAGERLRFDSSIVGHIHLSKPTCIFIKANTDSVNEPLLRSSQYETSIYADCLLRGANDLPRHLAKVAFYFEKQTFLLCENRLKGFSHLLAPSSITSLNKIFSSSQLQNSNT